MEKIKLLTFTVIALLLLNLGTLAFLFFSGSKEANLQERRPKPDKIIIERLQLDEDQQIAYRKLIHWHRNEINKLEFEIGKVKDQLYQGLGNDKNNVKDKDSLIALLSGYQKQIEYTHLIHFESIKNLCKKEQLHDFNELTYELAQIFSKPRPKHD